MVGMKSSATVAADAAVGQLDDIARCAGLRRAFLDQTAVEAGVAEFVDDHGDATTAGLGQERAQQRGFAGARKPVRTVTGTRDIESTSRTRTQVFGNDVRLSHSGKPAATKAASETAVATI